MRSRLAQTLPERFTTDDTLIVEAPFHDDMVFLGVLQVDHRRDSFEFIALNPAGIKLFDLRGDDSSVAVAQVLPPLEGLHKILLWVAHDLQHIYLDMVPPPTAVAHIHSDEVVYSQKSSNGTLVYRVAADGGNIPFLVEKRLGDWLGTIWRVRYFRYAPSSAGLYPHGIVMDNDQYHYRIIVKNRDVQVDP